MTLSARTGIAALCLGVFLATQAFVAPTHAQSSSLDSEIKRLQGHWRIIEMVDDGRVVSAAEMQRGLPGGGVVEIIDYTLLFKSPVDGSRSTKSFRLDPTTYPKEIAIIDRDKVTGVGIYQLDQGKFVICVANPAMPVPTEFSAPANSGRTMMVLKQQNAGEEELTALPAPPTRAVQLKTTSQAAPPANVKVAPTPTKLTASSNQDVAGRILTDAEVTRMLVGNWRMNDGEGLVDISINSNQTFNTFRHTQTMSNFHTVFVSTPVSTGNWSVSGGQLALTVTSSWRADRINTKAVFAVRSISSGDAIIVDSLGRVTRAVRR